MLIREGSITEEAAKGTFDLMFVGLNTQGFATEEIPDNWLMSVTYSNRGSGLRTEREEGLAHLSRIGWEANKDAIQKVFEASPIPQRYLRYDSREPMKVGDEVTWEAVEAKIEDDLRKIEKDTLKRISTFETKAAYLKEQLKLYYGETK